MGRLLKNVDMKQLLQRLRPEDCTVLFIGGLIGLGVFLVTHYTK